MTAVEAALMARIDEFARRLEDASATRRLPTPLGPLLLNDDFPLSYAHNFLRMEEVPPGLTAEQLTAQARAAFTAAGRDHLRWWWPTMGPAGRSWTGRGGSVGR